MMKKVQVLWVLNNSPAYAIPTCIGGEIKRQVALQSDAVSGGGEDDEEDTDDQSELVVLDPAHVSF